MHKELAIGVMNGTVWGLIVGLFAVGLYANPALGIVMSGAVVLNLLVAALPVSRFRSVYMRPAGIPHTARACC